jgi:hypothetical protein
MQTLSAKLAVGQRPPAKIERVLAALLDGPKTSRQLELAPVHDHVPHSTAGELRRRGVELRSELVEVPGYGGCLARVARYSIPDHARGRALDLLLQMRERRLRGGR